jgi:hypothetical protein
MRSAERHVACWQNTHAGLTVLEDNCESGQHKDPSLITVQWNPMGWTGYDFLKSIDFRRIRLTGPTNWQNRLPRSKSWCPIFTSGPFLAPARPDLMQRPSEPGLEQWRRWVDGTVWRRWWAVGTARVHSAPHLQQQYDTKLEEKLQCAPPLAENLIS